MNYSGERSRGLRAFAHQELKRVVRRISAQPINNGSQVKVSLVVSPEWVGIASAAVAFLDETVALIHRHSESRVREVRVAAILTKDQAEREAVWKRYDELRTGGLKHRAAVYKLVEDSSLFYHGRWKFSDYNWCVRVRPQKLANVRER